MSYLPRRDADLLNWANGASQKITATPTAFGLTAGFATSFAASVSAFATALAACDPGVRSKSSVATKNSAKKSLALACGYLSRLVHGTSSVTDAQLIELGLNVRAQPVPTPAPELAPGFDLVKVVNNTATYRAHDALTPSRRGRPKGVALLSVFSHVGNTTPTEQSGWILNGSTGRTTVEVAFDPSLPMGTKAWVCAFWSTATGLNGPACTPVEVTLLGGAALPSNTQMKLAA
jgi:hypothetical protein